MGEHKVLLIIAGEAIALCLFFIAVLILKNRKLRGLLNRLQERMEELVKQLRNARQQSTAPPPQRPVKQESYADKLDAQIELTKQHHYDLGSRQDISLDLDPDSPLPRRAAAIRHALLIAEKEATGGEGEIKWDFLATRYQQLLSFHEDYDGDDRPDNSEELEDLRAELAQTKKRINNLERFKVLYFELEEKFEKAKGEASEHYSEIQTLVSSESGNKEDLKEALANYHATYDEVGSLISRGVKESVSVESSGEHGRSAELERLRIVAANQHQIINELQDKLAETADRPEVEEVREVVDSLQSELKKQARFLQESETCIQLMEDELTTANQEIEMLRSRAKMVPELKKLAKDLENTVDKNDQIIGSLKTENRRLAKKLKLAQEAPPEDNQEARQLRKELSHLQDKYNDLEEKFLDLKLKD